MVMKIISNFRDYYDFMVAKYGIDPKIIYHRVPWDREEGIWKKLGMYKPYHIEFPETVVEYTIYFCGKEYTVYYILGDFFFGIGILNADPKKYPRECKYHEGVLAKDVHQMIKEWKGRYEKNRWLLYNRTQGAHDIPSDVNDKLECPVVVGDHKNPRLSDFNFAKVVSPEDAFITISNWLSREKVIPDTQTSKEKIVSHGFDLKTSFRKM